MIGNEKPYKRDDILQKGPMIVQSLLIVATPYSFSETYNRELPHM